MLTSVLQRLFPAKRVGEENGLRDERRRAACERARARRGIRALTQQNAAIGAGRRALAWEDMAGPSPAECEGGR